MKKKNTFSACNVHCQSLPYPAGKAQAYDPVPQESGLYMEEAKPMTAFAEIMKKLRSRCP
ncbi:hypothetical protein GCM10008934_19480 [Virgibacillus salarius]